MVTMSSPATRLALLAAASALWACASSQPSPQPTSGATAPAAAANAVAGDVTVTVDLSGLPDDKRQAFEGHRGSERLTSGVLAELRRTGKRPPAEPAELKIAVTGFRLRSTASRVWFGMMAGGDGLKVDVTVLGEGRTLKTYSTGSGSAVGGFGDEGRFDRLIATTSERIVQEL